MVASSKARPCPAQSDHDLAIGLGRRGLAVDDRDSDDGGSEAQGVQCDAEYVNP